MLDCIYIFHRRFMIPCKLKGWIRTTIVCLDKLHLNYFGNIRRVFSKRRSLEIDTSLTQQLSRKQSKLSSKLSLAIHNVTKKKQHFCYKEKQFDTLIKKPLKYISVCVMILIGCNIVF